jgi:hypothetical protein
MIDEEKFASFAIVYLNISLPYYYPTVTIQRLINT